MAKCRLDIENARFVALIGQVDRDLQQGLVELRDKLLNDHRLSGWFNHPMPSYPEYQNRIWKWDFAPAGDSSSTRKGWRIFGYVENPQGPEPYLVTPFLLYPKPGPRGNPATHIANALKGFLSFVAKIEPKEEKCHRRQLGDAVELICWTCGYRMLLQDNAEADIAEDTHECENSN